MTMLAIKVSEENIAKIITTGTSILNFDLNAFVSENKEKPLYYVPFMADSTAEIADRWATFPEAAFLETFVCEDLEKANTHFVEIDWK